jgi:hypothetical protein
MTLKEHFEQRTVETTYGSFRSLVPLSTPSGFQWTESELETELLEQLAFSPLVYDLITQPIIHYTLNGEARRYTPDIAAQLYGTNDDWPGRYIIEVKRQEDLAREPAKHAVRFEVGRICAEEMGAAFRVMDESEIRTDFLLNSRLLARYLQVELTDREQDGIELLRECTQLTVSEAVGFLGEKGFGEPDARYLIEYALARRLMQADLTVRLSDQTIMQKCDNDIRFSIRNDPILRLLQDAPDR